MNITEVELTIDKIKITSGSRERIIEPSDYCGTYFIESDMSNLVGKQIVDIIKKRNPVSRVEEPNGFVLETYQLIFLLNDNTYHILHLVNENEDEVDIYAHWR